jgi:hypothetical protein
MLEAWIDGPVALVPSSGKRTAVAPTPTTERTVGATPVAAP